MTKRTQPAVLASNEEMFAFIVNKLGDEEAARRRISSTMRADVVSHGTAIWIVWKSLGGKQESK